MEEWKEYKLEETTDFVAGFAFKSKHFGDYDNKVVKIKDIQPPIVSLEGADGVDLTEYDKAKLEKYIVRKNDFVLAMTGATIGKIGRYLHEQESYINQRVLKFIPKKEFDFDFIYYSLLSSAFQGYINNHIDSDSAQPNISANTIGKYTFRVPNKATQQKIANILSSLDDKIEVNRHINEQLEELAQALFNSWFVDFEPFKDGEFVESELGMIPQGWKVVKLDDVCSYISRGLTPKYDTESDEIVLGQTCVRNNIVTLNNGRKHRPKSKNEKWVRQWDVLINSTGVGSLGRVGIVYFNMDNVAIDSHITVVRPLSSLYNHYIGRLLLSKQAEIENMAIGSTGQTELPRDSVKSLVIILPTNNVLEEFNRSIEPMCKLMYNNLEEITHFTNLRNTLLPKLMSGEIDVNKVEI